MKLVDAQQGRRVVDRLVGYRLSPFLWKKVRRGLSAGRVQSVAVRLVVEREREILGFKAQEYWTIDVQLEKPAATPSFKAKLAGYVGKKGKLEITNETDAERHVAGLRSSAYSVLEINTKTTVRRPSAPFITSTLQQEASRRLGLTAKRTMAVAQQLLRGTFAWARRRSRSDHVYAYRLHQRGTVRDQRDARLHRRSATAPSSYRRHRASTQRR